MVPVMPSVGLFTLSSRAFSSPSVTCVGVSALSIDGAGVSSLALSMVMSIGPPTFSPLLSLIWTFPGMES